MANKRISEYSAATTLTGFNFLGNDGNVITKRGPIALLDARFQANMLVVNPVDEQFGAAGNKTADDTAEVQAAATYLGTTGGGVLLINHPHMISDSITLPPDVPLVIQFEGNGLLYCQFASAKTALSYTGTWDRYDTPAPVFIRPRIILASSSGAYTRLNAASTAIAISYTATDGGGTAGPVIEGGYIAGEAGTDYFLYGIDLVGAPHTQITRTAFRGRGGLSTTKFGAGIRIGDWGQGTKINQPNIRGFLHGVGVTDEAVIDTSEFQAEGIAVLNGNIQACTYGLFCDITDTEVAWIVHNNQFDQNDHHIHVKNINGIQISNNSFGSKTAGEHADIILDRTDPGGARNTKSHAALITGNRSFKEGNMNFDITAVSLGATTTVTYADTSAARTITNITIDADNAVLVTYTGSAAEVRNSKVIIISGVVGMTQANSTWKIGDVDVYGVKTFRLYEPGDAVNPLNIIDGSSWTAYTSGGQFVVSYGTGVIVDGGAVFIDQVGGTTQINSQPYVVAGHNSGAKTFRILNYITGAEVNSTAWTAWSSRGRLTHYVRFVEVRGGSKVKISGNAVVSRNVAVHAWPMTKGIELTDNQLIRTGSMDPLLCLDESNYTGSFLIKATQRNGALTPWEFGADPSGELSSSNAINELFDAIRTASVGATDHVPYEIDCNGGTWLIDKPIDCTAMEIARNINVRGGSFIGTCAGDHMFDLTGSRWFKFWGCHFWGDETSPPVSGVFCGRDSGGTAADGQTFYSCSSDGYFTKGGYWNYSSENNRHFGCLWWNRYSHADAYGAIVEGFNTYTPTSDFQTIDSGLNSCLHTQFEASSFVRTPAYTLTVTGVTRANPAVVSYTANKDPTNADVGWFNQDIGGMTQIRGKKFTVANVNAGANTFELSGVDSTAYTAYTSGGLFSKETGPALFVGDCAKINFENCYAVAYYDYAVRLDAMGGIGVTSGKFDLHIEGAQDYSYKIISNDISCSWYDVEFKDNSPWATKGMFNSDATTATHSFRRFLIDMGNPEEDWTVGLHHDPARFALQTGLISSIEEVNLPADPSLYVTYRVDTFASNGTPQFKSYVDRDSATDAGAGVTVSAYLGRITTQSLTTAVGASTTIAVTCASITSNDMVFVQQVGGTSTTGVPVFKVVTTAGSYTITIYNVGAAVFNGTLILSTRVNKVSA